jgi:hypothetical protein
MMMMMMMQAQGCYRCGIVHSIFSLYGILRLISTRITRALKKMPAEHGVMCTELLQLSGKLASPLLGTTLYRAACFVAMVHAYLFYVRFSEY